VYLSTKSGSASMQIKILNIDNHGDVIIAQAAAQFLQWTVALPLETLTISILNGWLTISGRVSWLSQKRAATQALQSIPGLIGLSDHVDIRNLECCPSPS
jgi:osmotically-inducible protein OsmY